MTYPEHAGGLLQALFGNNLSQVLYLGVTCPGKGPCLHWSVLPLGASGGGGDLLSCPMLLEALPGGLCRTCLAVGFLHSHMVTKDDRTLIKTIWGRGGFIPGTCLVLSSVQP